MIPSIAKHLVCQCAFASMVLAGTTPNPKSPAIIPPAPPAKEAWEFTLSPYGWAAGLTGTTGVKGFTVETDVPFKDILSNLDMAAMLNLEARKGRWGGWVDGLYLKMSAGAETPGPLFDSIGLSIEQVMAEAAVFYRVVESKRGFLDLYAGARYVSVSGELSLDLNDTGVEQVSQQLSERAVDSVVSAVKNRTQAALENHRTEIASHLTTEARAKVSGAVTERAAQAEDTLNDLREIAAAHPLLVEVIRHSPQIRAAIRSMAEAQIDAQLAELKQKAAAASTEAVAVKAELQAAANRARDRAKRAVANAERKLADKIEATLRNSIPSEVSGTASWVDPFVGARARYNFTDRFYAIAKADIGGFGVSSDLVWQVYGALGYQLSKKTSVELGYKHMAMDYTSGGFTYDVAMSGAMLNVSFKY